MKFDYLSFYMLLLNSFFTLEFFNLNQHLLLIYLCYTCTPDDGNLKAESDSGEFWVILGGFAPIGKKVPSEDDVIPERTAPKLYR